MNSEELQKIKDRYPQRGMGFLKTSQQRTQALDDIDELVLSVEELLACRGQLKIIKKQAWKQVELTDGNYVTFVGVHVVGWKKSWGQPTVAFNRWNDMPKLEEDTQEPERVSPGGPDGSGA